MHCFAFVHKVGKFGYIVQVAAQNRSHIFGRIISLQICCLESYPGIAGGMTLIKGIRREFLPVRPYFFQYFRVVIVSLTTFKELLFKGHHFINQLFTHCLTQRVALASRKVSQQTRQKHDLFLIYRNTICIFKILFHNGYIINYRGLAMFSGNKVGNIRHRARPVQGIHGYEILKYRRLQFAKIFLHTGRLKLECTSGAAFAIKLVCGFVVNRNIVNIHIYASRKFYICNGFLYY